jgi:hypothetical protein
MTLTGGLWFEFGRFDTIDRARSMLLIFAGISKPLMIIALSDFLGRSRRIASWRSRSMT